MINAIYIIAAFGIILSLYTLYLKYKLGRNQKYKAVCDINNRMSCTKTVSSSDGSLFGISNGWWGILYYLAIISLLTMGHIDLMFYATIFGVLFSCRLAYILYFKLKNFCLVCNGIYVVNILLVVFGYLIFR